MNPARLLCAGLGILCCTVPMAEPLPQPLTLEYALSLAAETHPDVDAQLAELDLARARQARTVADTGIDARIIADGRWVDPSTRQGVEDGDVHLAQRFTSALDRDQTSL